jgi:hypothetical protein
MKLYLNIILIAFFSIPCLGTRTETQTVEEDGTVKTVVTDEWTEERTFGRGHGRGHGSGDTIVVMTNDNDNVEPQTSKGTSNGQNSCDVTSKTVPMKRFFKGPDSYSYSSDQQKETALTNSGYTVDGAMGRVVAQRSNFPECRDLFPIIGVTSPGDRRYNILTASVGAAITFTRVFSWSETGVIGYAVQEKGKCGATVPVRALHKNLNGLIQYLQITDADGEIDDYKNLGYVLPGYQEFYVWDENAHFCPQPRPIEKKTALLTRLYNSQLTDFDYTTSPKVEEILTKPSGGYRFDGSLGRVVIKPSDLPECKDLVPIIKLFMSSYTDHVLLVDQADVDNWVKSGWTNAGVIGYGVLEKDICGATVEVRHAFLHNADPNLKLFFVTSVLSQYENVKTYGFADMGTKNFYIWEA